ncbi:MAG: DNA-binding response regulator [Acidobacteria bacterium]|nr:MAG: DNA-binding response regulator [Acidobacteriota bacterium]
MAAPLRVVVVGEDPLARSALLSLLDGREDLLVAGQGTPEEALALLRSTGADLVLWDLGVDLAPDIEALREATDAGAAPVLVLAPEHARVPDLLGAGVAGVLGRDADALRLAAALHAAAEDLLVVERALSDGALRTRPAAEALVEPLTPRELEVLQLLGHGLSNRALAARLHISEHTAKFHVNAILGKLGAQTRAEAVAQGVRLGLLLL